MIATPLVLSWVASRAMHERALRNAARLNYFMNSNDEHAVAGWSGVTLPLHGDKADALFELLRPANVDVDVWRHRDGRVVVRGSAAEIRALQHLTDLVNQFERMTPSEVVDRVRESRDRGLERRAFHLPQDSADALQRLLHSMPVPAQVERERTRIEVRATDDEMRVIESIVRIARGERP